MLFFDDVNILCNECLSDVPRRTQRDTLWCGHQISVFPTDWMERITRVFAASFLLAVLQVMAGEGGTMEECGRAVVSCRLTAAPLGNNLTPSVGV